MATRANVSRSPRTAVQPASSAGTARRAAKSSKNQSLPAEAPVLQASAAEAKPATPAVKSAAAAPARAAAASPAAPLPGAAPVKSSNAVVGGGASSGRANEAKAPTGHKEPKDQKALKDQKDQKERKGPKEKLVRDSFTMPRADFALIAQLKDRALVFKRPTKKSELLRAGLQALAGLDDAALKAALERLPLLKTGRPRKASND